MSNIDLDGMNRDELNQLQDDITARLREYRPYRIKSRVVSCSSPSCWCSEGEDGHGPYLFATYRDGGKTKTLSLGPQLEKWEIEEAQLNYPDRTQFLRTPNHKYLEMPRSKTTGWVSYELTELEFLERHGIIRANDTFGRPGKFWGSSDDYNRYEMAWSMAHNSHSIIENQWVDWGVGNLDAIAKLETLEAKNYYLKV